MLKFYLIYNNNNNNNNNLTQTKTLYIFFFWGHKIVHLFVFFFPMYIPNHQKSPFACKKTQSQI